jgi:hypothetical protein
VDGEGTRAAAASGRNRFLQLYYLATPAFFLLDWLGGIRLRVPLPEEFPYRWAYYAFCAVCALICMGRVRLSPLVGLVESTLCILMLITGVMWPLYEAMNAVPEGRPMPEFVFSWQQLAGFCLSGTVFCVSFYRNEAALRREIARAFGR